MKINQQPRIARNAAK